MMQRLVATSRAIPDGKGKDWFLELETQRAV